MKGFIEVHNSNGTHLLNVKHIEEVLGDNDGRCTIYLAFCVPGAVDQDYIIPDVSYDEVKQMIKEAIK